jgi:hypothetical protein
MDKVAKSSEVTGSTKARACIEVRTQITVSGDDSLTYSHIVALLQVLGEDLGGRRLGHGAATRGPGDDEVDPAGRGPGDDEVDPGGG